MIFSTSNGAAQDVLFDFFLSVGQLSQQTFQFISNQLRHGGTKFSHQIKAQQNFFNQTYETQFCIFAILDGKGATNLPEKIGI